MKCSVNDECDEGDLMKTAVYNKLSLNNEKSLKLERGISKISEHSISNIRVSPLNNKHVSTPIKSSPI